MAENDPFQSMTSLRTRLLSGLGQLLGEVPQYSRVKVRRARLLAAAPQGKSDGLAFARTRTIAIHPSAIRAIDSKSSDSIVSVLRW